jgi:hypothetical protein
MISHLAHIYRTADNSRRSLVGVVEEVGVEGNRAFSNLDELWSIPNSSETRDWEV